MPSESQSRFWRKCRIAFRRFRIAVLLVILLLVTGLVYLNQVGLPGFIKRPLLSKVHDRGLDLQFRRIRWRWDRGIVADDVHFGRADQTGGPTLSLKQVQVKLDHRALARFQLQVKSLLLRQGQLVWMIPSTNTPPRRLSVDDIQAEPPVATRRSVGSHATSGPLRGCQSSVVGKCHKRIRAPELAMVPTATHLPRCLNRTPVKPTGEHFGADSLFVAASIERRCAWRCT